MTTNIEIHGDKHIPKAGCLTVASRLDYQGMMQLAEMLAERPITWLCEENISLCDQSRSYLENPSTTAASFSNTDEDPQILGENLKHYLKENGVIIYLTGDVSATIGESSHVSSPNLKLLCQLGLDILPLSVSYPKEITTAAESSQKLPECQLSFSFSPLITATKATPAAWREAIHLAEEVAMSARRFLTRSLGETLIHGFKNHGSSTVLLDGTDDSSTSFNKVFAAALALSIELKKSTTKKRIGIILPPGKGGMIANVAVVLAGKVPVNINFTASHGAIHSAIKQANIDRFITADGFMRKVSSFPWPPTRDLIFIERLLPSLKKKIIRWALVARLLSPKLLCKILGLDKSTGDDEAVLLFTSGSSGEPKGVPLSHRNVLANVCQFGSRINLHPDSTIMGCLPLFHSFGSTVTLWYPCIQGISLVTYPSPLETKRLAELISMHSVNMLLSTPTFLRGYMKRIKAEQLASLQYVVTGAEKLPQSLAKTFQEKFGILPMEGYGLTETSPATNLNLPNAPQVDGKPLIESNRFGSVGKLLPGIAIKITNPTTDEPSPIDTAGIIWLKGANVFQGYLDNTKKTNEVIKDGWFNTGDIGRVDEDGFLYIEGRLSRFSKIAGEMVPHETLEAAITKALELDQDTKRRIAVVGIPDEKKGEAIALLSTVCGETLEQECIDLRYKLMDEGIPSLWCPKSFIPVDEIPILASGKLDIKGCQQLAEKS